MVFVATHRVQTTCWRNYVAEWRIDNGRLFLDRITGIFALDGQEPLIADWVTETLRIARGERLAYVHMGFGSVFEEDVLLNMRMGEVVGQTIRDNRGQAHDTARLGWENLPSDETVTPGLESAGVTSAALAFQHKSFGESFRLPGQPFISSGRGRSGWKCTFYKWRIL